MLDVFLEIACILRKADAYEPEENTFTKTQFNFERYNAVWNEAIQLRSSGDLLGHAGRIGCPVLAIHGNYDPHPADGVAVPLAQNIRDFRFILLEKCGHEPWSEKHAKTRFLEILMKEIGD